MRVVGLSKAAVMAVVLATFHNAQAADLGREQSEIQRAVDEAKRKAQSNTKGYSLQSAGPNIDRDLQALSSSANALMSCSNSKAAFKSQYGSQIGQAQSILGNVNQLLSNSVLKAIAAPALASILPGATSLVKQLASTCQSVSSQAGAANSKYEQVSQVMRSEFSGGDLSPGSRAVRHAADVDMPARGGNPEALRQYLRSQNGQVKKWYRDNFQLK
ncbi:MAG: hypothetical protein ACXWUS_19240 [Burkholderiales bacterium]